MGFPPQVKENLFVACQRCCCICHEFKGSKMEVHHIIQKADGGEDTEENGIPLCFDCHAEAGSYNSKHPKGNKISSSELRRHKEQWLESCKNRLDPIKHSHDESKEQAIVGIKSFERATEDMPEDTLSLVDFFDGRYIKEDYQWDKEIFNSLDEFTDNFDSKYEYKIYLETHLSIAFVSGYLLDSKSGIKIYPMQKTEGISDWSPENDYKLGYPELKTDIETLSDEKEDVALVLGISRSILGDVKEFIKESELGISKIIHCNIDGRSGLNVIKDGTHAIELANSISKVLEEKRDTAEKRNTLHIFAACPVAFIFYLGQLSRMFGKIVLYEFDTNDITYLESFKLPIR